MGHLLMRGNEQDKSASKPVGDGPFVFGNSLGWHGGHLGVEQLNLDSQQNLSLHYYANLLGTVTAARNAQH